MVDITIDNLAGEVIEVDKTKEKAICDIRKRASEYFFHGQLMSLLPAVS